MTRLLALRRFQKFLFDHEEKSEFTRETFVDLFDERLQVRCTGDRRQQVVDSEAERLIDMALKTGVFSEDDDDLKSDEYELRVMYSGTRGPDHAEKAVKPKYKENIAYVEVGQRAYDKMWSEFDRDTHLGDFE